MSIESATIDRKIKNDRFSPKEGFELSKLKFKKMNVFEFGKFLSFLAV